MNELKIVTKEEFAKNLKYYITRKGVTQVQVAAYAKVSTGTVSDWCKGRSYPRMDKIQLLAEFLECNKSDLIEERSINNQYYVEKATNELYEELLNEPQMVEMFRKFKRLSHEEIQIIETLVNKFLKESKI